MLIFVALLYALVSFASPTLANASYLSFAASRGLLGLCDGSVTIFRRDTDRPRLCDARIFAALFFPVSMRSYAVGLRLVNAQLLWQFIRLDIKPARSSALLCRRVFARFRLRTIGRLFFIFLVRQNLLFCFVLSVQN